MKMDFDIIALTVFLFVALPFINSQQIALKDDPAIPTVLKNETIPANSTTNSSLVVTTMLPPNTTTINSTVTTANSTTNGTSINGTTTLPPPTTNATTVTPPVTTLAPVTTPPPAHNVTTTEKTTSSPLPSATPSPEKNRSFDGLSFIGGMVLAVGLLAIGVVAFKSYKARGESASYFTL